MWKSDWGYGADIVRARELFLQGLAWPHNTWFILEHRRGVARTLYGEYQSFPRCLICGRQLDSLAALDRHREEHLAVPEEQIRVFAALVALHGMVTAEGLFFGEWEPQ